MLDFDSVVATGSLRVQGASIPSRRARSREVVTQDIPVYQSEMWTALQRQASSIHEISYRACYKPQLPAYFIERLTEPGEDSGSRCGTLYESNFFNRRSHQCFFPHFDLERNTFP